MTVTVLGGDMDGGVGSADAVRDGATVFEGSAGLEVLPALVRVYVTAPVASTAAAAAVYNTSCGPRDQVLPTAVASSRPAIF